MRIARTLAAAALAALAALALTATTAGAQTVEITEEDTVNHCPAVTATGHGASGGCVIHATGEVELLGHVFGIESVASNCVIEFEGHADENGEGFVDFAEFEDHAGQNDCVRLPCEQQLEHTGPMEPWPVHINETGAGGELTLDAEFCVEPDNDHSPRQRCGVSFHVVEGTPGSHDYELADPNTGAEEFHFRGENHANAPNCEVEGQIHIEDPDAAAPHQDIEIAHL